MFLQDEEAWPTLLDANGHGNQGRSGNWGGRETMMLLYLRPN